MMNVGILFLIGLNAFGAAKVEDCGLYDIYGQFLKNGKTKFYELVVNPKSISEYRFQITDQQERAVAPYIGHSVKVTATILKKAPDYRGELEKISKVSITVPDTANFSGHGGFTLLSKEKCK